jgi:hypothetical protein
MEKETFVDQKIFQNPEANLKSRKIHDKSRK